MYKAILSGSATGKSGRVWRFSAGGPVYASKGELDHCKSVIWVGNEDFEPAVEVVEPKSSKDYTISELRDMDLSEKGDAFFEGDERKSIDDIR